MKNQLKTELCIIGAGSGGLSVAAAAAQLGVDVTLIEAEKMGGDCLNFGCVPSKSLLAAAKIANQCRTADSFGLSSTLNKICIDKVMQYVQSVISKIAPHDSVERFESLGVKVIKGKARFVSPKIVEVNDLMIRARHFVIATGSSPTIPLIPGIQTIPYYTNETLFNLSENPEHLIIIGGGPIGCEMAQAFLLLGVKVTLVEVSTILPKDDSELVSILKSHLISQGLNLLEKVKITKIALQGNHILVNLDNNGDHLLQGTHLLVATGRKPNIDDLNLDAAKVLYTPKGITVNNRLRTSNRKIYALGDVTGGYQFTHIANYHAGIIIRNILFKLPAKTSLDAVPWVTYTHPELAHYGYSPLEIASKYPTAKTLVFSLSENDRAQAENESVGKIKIVISSSGRILSADILAPHAGDLLLPWVHAIQHKKHIGIFANTIVPYPTMGEISKAVAAEFYKPLLFSSKVRVLVKLLNIFG